MGQKIRRLSSEIETNSNINSKQKKTMKRTITTLSATVALAAIIGTLGSLHTTRAQDQQGQASVVGTWIVAVNVDTPGGSQPLATELASFNPGGTFMDAISIAFSSENPAFAGPFAPLAVNFSDAFGTWRPVGGDSSQFAATFKRFLFAGANTPTATYGSFFPGQNVGQATIEVAGALQITKNGDMLLGSYTFQLTNLQGTVVLAAGGTFTATRVNVQPLAGH
jgi:hypothetical protein